MTMPIADLMVEGLRLMAIGMGIVFGFLLFLVAFLRLMSLAALRLAPPAPPVLPKPESVLAPPADHALVAAITAAVHRYRASRSDRSVRS